MSITALFKRIGAPLANARWSWGAVRHDGTVVLRVWKDKKRMIGDAQYMQVTHHHHYAKNPGNLGYQERNRHVELIKAGAPSLMVMCEAVDVGAIPRTIKTFHRKEVLIGGALVERYGDYWLEFVGRTPIGKLAAGAPG